jgi:hypothetical protein
LGLSIPVFLVAPTMIGQQDLIALVSARQPSIAERLRQHVLLSPFGTIHAATFSFPRPVGATVPEVPADYRLASLDLSDLEFTGSIGGAGNIDIDDRNPPAQLTFPTVNRALKGDFLVPRARLEPQPPSPPDAAPKAQPQRKPALANERSTETNTASLHVDPSQTLDTTPLTRADQLIASGAPSTSTELGLARPARMAARHDPSRPDAATDRMDKLAPVVEANRKDMLTPDKDEELSDTPVAVIGVDPSPTVTTANLYFGIDRLGGGPEVLEPWAPGEEPVLTSRVNADPDIKLSALTPGAEADASRGGETVASKGEVTGLGRRPVTPAERLGLDTKGRAKAEKCLTEAVYFESRGESERGQKAVAQVVMNRVFSGFYPSTVCGVVYQNSHRHLACQFTFACDNVADRVTEPDMWAQAKRIAQDTLDGKIWLPEIGKSTHYHAYWVRPSWVNEMRKLNKIGVHTFYRPRAWGDGADEPAWGSGAKQNLESGGPADQAVEN